jgi:hypothetical protein
MKCECDEEDCRKVIGDFPTIPKSQRRKYFKHGVTPDFILEILRQRKDEILPSIGINVE